MDSQEKKSMDTPLSFTWVELYLSKILNEIEDPGSSFIHPSCNIFRSTKSNVQWLYIHGQPFMGLYL